ncbi:unnamed protein product [Porites lobata]|uniref:Uncharacterized protein n=1 Tax=Porites lobata TaxID=104759 RepID=A0ABN8NW02_9CNID|nr:unnamed protein product [Porites lobata]
MINGMASEISFVSKHGPAKFYWIKPGNKGSKNKTQLLLIEANGSRKSSVLSAPRKVKLKPSQKLR